jgi:hypothetical protein
MLTLNVPERVSTEAAKEFGAKGEEASPPPESPREYDIVGIFYGIPSAIRRFVAGREFPATDEHGLAAGIVRVNSEGASYGYTASCEEAGPGRTFQ